MAGRGRGRGQTLPAWMTSGEVDFKGDEAPSFGSSAASSISTPSQVVPIQTNLKPIPIATQAPRFVPPPTIAPAFLKPPSAFPIANPNIPQQQMAGYATNNSFQGIPTNPTLSRGGYPGYVPQAVVKSSLPPTAIGDPNNDATNWTEHDVPSDGRKYWYNRATLSSTYEKPFCLKTPEERSIPPCKYKEYTTTDGSNKKYYSDGKDSVWVMPEEYRIWKEKIDAIEKKKLLALTTAQEQAKMSHQSSQQSVRGDINHDSSSIRSIDHGKRHNDVVVEKETELLPVYKSKEEAIDAFKSLLIDSKISSTAGWKEVEDICSRDIRWQAVIKIGEKKQALAEYKTKKEKQDKELLKTKARKSRDQFLTMLAENTDIDARTRWRDVMHILKDDFRFKNVEVSEREDLFNDFALELEKKEKEDRNKQRAIANRHVNKLLDDLHRSGTITRKSVWTVSKGSVMEQLRGTELRFLDETDLRRSFQEFVGKLESDHRDAERRQHDEIQQEINIKKDFFKADLLDMLKNGKFSLDSKWKDLQIEISEKDSYKELLFLIDVKGAGLKLDTIYNNPRSIFETIITDAKEIYRDDKRLIRDTFKELRFEVTHTSKISDMNMIINKAAGLSGYVKKNEINSAEGKAAEDGEEVEEISKNNEVYVVSSSTKNKVLNLISSRPANVRLALNEILELAIIDHEEDLKHIKKHEERLSELLEEYFYRSDHVGIDWEEGQKSLLRHSSYEVLGKSVCENRFLKHMVELELRLEEKNKSMRNFRESANSEIKVSTDSNILELSSSIESKESNDFNKKRCRNEADDENDKKKEKK